MYALACVQHEKVILFFAIFGFQTLCWQRTTDAPSEQAWYLMHVSFLRVMQDFEVK